MSKRIYLDCAAGVPIRREVREVMESLSYKDFANPSAIYKEAQEAKKLLQESREKIAGLIGAKSQEVVFVSNSTEANNLAILGWAKANPEGQIITTQIEHPSILEPVKKLEKDGHKVYYLDVDKEGFISLKNLNLQLSTSSTKLTSLAWANSDIGTVQPINEMSEIVKDKATLHIDVSHTEGLFNLKNIANVADLVTISSTKIGGPGGIAALIIKSGIKIEPIIYGGGQEGALRSGTENVVLAVGFAKALELAQKEQVKESERLKKLRNELIKEVLSKIDNVLLTGPQPNQERLPNHISFAFSSKGGSASGGKNIDGEELVIRLDEKGFAVGTGSACLSAQAGSTAKTEISQAIKTIGIPEDYQQGTLRITLGKDTTKKDVIIFIKTLKQILNNAYL